MAGWDAFLTEQDKAHIAYLGPRDKKGFGENPCLLVIDDYYGVLGTEREPILESIKTWPASTGLEGWKAIDETVGLIAAAREDGVPVVYCHGLETMRAPWAARRKTSKPRADRYGPDQEELKRKANQIVEEIAPQPGDLVIQKAAASVFHGTSFLFWLNYEGIDTIITAGETTSGCVRASVVDGATYRFHMGVVEECVFDRTQASHWMNLFDMNQKYADVIKKQEAIDYFDYIKAK